MRINVKALRTKPFVGIHVAVGAIEFKADCIEDAAILCTLADIYTGGGDKGLIKALKAAANKKILAIRKHEPEFTFTPPKRRA